MKPERAARMSKNGIRRGCKYSSHACNLLYFFFRFYSLEFALKLYAVIIMLIKIKTANIPKLLPSHVESPRTDSNLGVPLNTFVAAEHSTRKIIWS